MSIKDCHRFNSTSRWDYWVKWTPEVSTKQMGSITSSKTQAYVKASKIIKTY